MLLRQSTSVFWNAFRNITRIQRLGCPSVSSSALPPNNVLVEVSPDGDYIVCWHPEPAVPYELTKPMPRKVEDIKESDSVLKVQYMRTEQARFRPGGPTNPELVKMFTTSKVHFRPKPRRIYSKKNPPVDRNSI